MTTATATPTTPDLVTLAADAERRLKELRPARQRLSLDALADPAGAEALELASIEDEIAAAERLLDQARLAEDERAHREQEAQRLSEEAARADGQRKAERLAISVVKAEGKVDAGFATAAGAVAALADVRAEWQAAMVQAGERPQPDHLLGSRLESALAFALAAVGQGRAIDLPPSMGRGSRPLVAEAEK